MIEDNIIEKAIYYLKCEGWEEEAIAVEGLHKKYINLVCAIYDLSPIENLEDE